MFQTKIFLPILFVLCSMAACISPPEYDIVPEIEFISISANELSQGPQDQPIELVFGFTDGDGDLGSDSTLNVFLIDSRDEFETAFKLPVIPPQGTNNGISGEVTIEIRNQVELCCITPDNPLPCQPSTTFPFDTLTFGVYIVDQAGNRSNQIATTPIILRCD